MTCLHRTCKDIIDISMGPEKRPLKGRAKKEWMRKYFKHRNCYGVNPPTFLLLKSVRPMPEPRQKIYFIALKRCIYEG